ncbi:MAG: hypothetical protein KC620_21860, partial [Myxococcales bacterium]|nr:hypothetical protein [Myxococcales bacterium]
MKRVSPGLLVLCVALAGCEDPAARGEMGWPDVRLPDAAAPDVGAPDAVIDQHVGDADAIVDAAMAHLDIGPPAPECPPAPALVYDRLVHAD